MTVCYLGIGSNLGNRGKNIALAVEKINTLRDTKIIGVSKIRQTKPVGGPAGQGKFLNGVLKIKTKFSAAKLMWELKKIEAGMGRRKTVRWGPRVIDLDILLYAEKVIKRKDLTIPHPRLFQRDFVLKPLLEVI